MQFGYTILYVENVAKSLAFYETALGLSRKFLHESGDFGELDTGPTTLAFCSRRLLAEMQKNPQRPNPHAASSEVAFVTQTVAAAYERALAAGAQPMQAPQDMPWGQTVAYIADPEGHLIELCSPMAP